MKKKLKELNEKGMQKICEKYYLKKGTCFLCPLQIGNDGCFKYVNLEQEIEVEE